jgi:hypothetical protein
LFRTGRRSIISLMADDALPWHGNWPPPVGYWSLTLPDGRAVVEALVDEHGGEMHFTCTECGSREDFYCDLCAAHFVRRHSDGDHRRHDEIPPGERHIPKPHQGGE